MLVRWISVFFLMHILELNKGDLIDFYFLEELSAIDNG